MNAMSEISADRGEALASPEATVSQAEARFPPAIRPEAVSKMRESADITKIAPALVRAQAALENPPRNRAVQVRTQAGAYTFRYATLDKITEMTRRALAENGLCVLQPIVSTERGPALVTRLLHESGQWMECEILMPPLGNNPQGFGSAITYLRRYSVSALLNIAADEDDDANRAAGNHVEDASTRQSRRGSGGANPSGAKAPSQQDRSEASRKGETGEIPPFVVVSRDNKVKELADARAWLAEWKLRLKAVETAKNGGPADKRRTVAAMMEANAGVFARLHELGHEATVQELGRAQDALMVRLDEMEHAR